MPRFRSVLRRAAGRFIPRFAPPLQCVGCGRGHTAGVRLISGPGLYICSDCVIAEIPGTNHGSGPLEFRLCRWCRTPRLSSQLLPLRGTLACACCRETLAALAENRSSARPDT
jgi:hypothetical protein